MSRFDTQIQAGMRLLAERVPGWLSQIDLDTLDLRSPCRCVLGQTFGRYGEGLEQLSFGLDEAVDHGFDTYLPATHEYAALTLAWKQAILARRAEPQP